MASRLLETIRSSILDSIKGRKLGVDVYGFLCGAPDISKQVEELTSTAATSLSYYGYTNILVTGSSQTSQPTLQAPPYAGITKTVMLQSTSTGCQQVILSGGALIIGDSLTTAGSTMFSLVKQAAVINLLSLSSVLWRRIDRASSLVSSDAGGIIYSTST